MKNIKAVIFDLGRVLIGIDITAFFEFFGQQGSNFDYSGPFTEWVVMGNLCLRFSGKLQWDGKNMRFTNRPEANNFVHKEYRRVWEL